MCKLLVKILLNNGSTCHVAVGENGIARIRWSQRRTGKFALTVWLPYQAASTTELIIRTRELAKHAPLNAAPQSTHLPFALALSDALTKKLHRIRWYSRWWPASTMMILLFVMRDVMLLSYMRWLTGSRVTHDTKIKHLKLSAHMVTFRMFSAMQT